MISKILFSFGIIIHKVQKAALVLRPNFTLNQIKGFPAVLPWASKKIYSKQLNNFSLSSTMCGQATYGK